MDAGWWIGGMCLPLPNGMVSYHLPDALWPLLDGAGIETRDRAPDWDGHMSADVFPAAPALACQGCGPLLKGLTVPAEGRWFYPP